MLTQERLEANKVVQVLIVFGLALFIPFLFTIFAIGVTFALITKGRWKTMLNIKFSHPYEKLKDTYPAMLKQTTIQVTEGTLLHVHKTRFEDLEPIFIDYDTVYYIEEKQTDGSILHIRKHYPIPKKGDCLFMLFESNLSNLFTTIRRWTPRKEEYYRKNVGEYFELVMTYKKEGEP